MAKPLEDAAMKLSELFTGHGSDKNTVHSYGPIYDELYPESKRLDVRGDILEIGVLEGASLRALQEFFPNADVHGLDRNRNYHHKPVIWYGDQGNPEFMAGFAGTFLTGLDLVIDDGSHKFADQWVSFLALWPCIRRGGRYIIEDITSIDRWRLLDNIPGFTIHDLRDIKGRSDDVMVVFEKF